MHIGKVTCLKTTTAPQTKGQQTTEVDSGPGEREGAQALHIKFSQIQRCFPNSKFQNFTLRLKDILQLFLLLCVRHLAVYISDIVADILDELDGPLELIC
jgi:hypothetical protein